MALTWLPVHTVDAAEPNNEMAEATAAGIGEAISFAFEKADDRDYFKLRAPGDGVIRFQLTGESGPHQPYPWWGEREHEGKMRLHRAGLWDRRVRQEEEVFFALRSHRWRHGQKASDHSLTGKFSFEPAQDAEPNDRAEQAIAVKIDEVFAFSLNPQYDRDYFTLRSPGNGVVRFVLTQKSNAHTPYPWWGEVTGEEGKTYENRSGMWDITATAGEQLVFAIRSHRFTHTERGSPDVLKGKFVFEPALPHEPNNTAEKATGVDIGETITFQLNPQYDRDYFTLTSPGDGIIRFRLLEKSKDHSPYPWWGEYIGEDKKSYERRSGQWDIEAQKGESVTMAIRSHRFNHVERGTPEKLKGVFEFHPRTDPEPNNDAASATPAKIGEPVRFQLTPRLDRDYFAVRCEQKGVLRFRIRERPDNAKHLHPWWGETTGNDGRLYERRSGQWDRAVEAGETAIFAIRSHLHAHAEYAIDEPISGVFEFEKDDSGEPNDTPEQAVPVGLEKPFQVVLNPHGDRDCFRVTAPGRGMLRLVRLDENGPHPGLHPDWIHADRAYSGYWEGRAHEAGEEIVIRFQSHRHPHLFTASDQAARIQLQFIPEPAVTETGETLDTARQIEIGKPFNFALMPLWDRDHFRFTAPKDGHLQLKWVTALTRDASVTHHWRRADDGKRINQRVIPVQAGQSYLLSLTPFNHSWSSEQPMTAMVEYTDAPPLRERRWSFEIERLSP